MSEVSLKRFYFALFDDGLYLFFTLKTLKLAFIGFLIQTLHIQQYVPTIMTGMKTENGLNYFSSYIFSCGGLVNVWHILLTDENDF